VRGSGGAARHQAHPRRAALLLGPGQGQWCPRRRWCWAVGQHPQAAAPAPAASAGARSGGGSGGGRGGDAAAGREGDRGQVRPHAPSSPGRGLFTELTEQHQDEGEGEDEQGRATLLNPRGALLGSEAGRRGRKGLRLWRERDMLLSSGNYDVDDAIIQELDSGGAVAASVVVVVIGQAGLGSGKGG
jgi:hypothetical protein